MSQIDLIATSAFGLEAVVARELAGIGFEGRPTDTGRIHFRGNLDAIPRTNLWLRAADRVLVCVGVFEARDFGALFDQTYALPWEEWIGPDAEFPVNGRSLKSQLSSVPACQKIVKKAIVEKLKAAHRVDELPETGPQYTIEVALLKDRATLTIDTSGAGLNKRGYRKLVGDAQIKETMAAALVLLSYWRPDRPLIDPFCGTGTIPIEAALIGRQIAPGLGREFAAEAWPRLPAATWQAARNAARAVQQADMPARIIGTDISAEALSLARYHAEQAGVSEQIHFQQRAFADLTSKKQYGVLIANPPYGERLGDDAELDALYRSMPLVLRNFKTWSHYVLTAYPDFERLVGQSADRRRKLYNGRIECTYYQFFGPRPPAQRLAEAADADDDEREAVEQHVAGNEAVLNERTVALQADQVELQAPAPARAAVAVGKSHAPGRPAFGGLSGKAYEQAAILRNRLTARARHLRRWPARGITCYRLYDRDIPEIPLAIDRYEACLHVAEYDRPHTRTVAEHADWLELMMRTAAETLEVNPADVFLKRRERQHGTAQYERFSDEGRTLVAQEGGLKFRVNLSDYLDTGLFLDHRLTRGMVRAAAEGKRVLNLFCYTGAFSVYAAAGGAVSTTSVDLSNTYLDWARANLELNGFSGPAHELVRDDVYEYLNGLPKRELFDLAVVDPPTFSNSKRTEEYWDIQRDHGALLAALIARLSPGGTIYFSTNFRRFKLDESSLRGVTIREITAQTLPEDFRNKRIHQCWRLVRGE